MFGPPRDWDWHKDAEGKTCAYVSLDATGVCQQGARGAKAEGRMVTVAMVYNPVPEARERRACPDGPAPRFDVRYVAGSDGMAALGEPLRRQAAQVGMDRAERWIAISDGGSGLEDWLRTNFGRVDAVILDFYHAAEYLGDPRPVRCTRTTRPRASPGSAMVPPAQARGRAGGPGGTARPGRSRGREARRGSVGGGALLREPVAPDGLPELRGEGLGDRLGAGRIGVQDGDRPADEGGGDAVGDGRGRRRRPPAGAVQERGPAVGRLLASHNELT